MANLLRDLRYALRSLARVPAFSLAIVLTFALGIGATSAVFSALHAILLRPLPLPDADRIMMLGQDQGRIALSNIGPVRLEDWNSRNSTFEALTGYYNEDISDSSGDLPERLKQSNVAPRFLDVWGVAPMLGRGFAPVDHANGAAPVAMISERYWRRRFNGDAAVLGTSQPIGARSFTLVGVLPASFTLPDRDVDVWVALVYAPFTQSRQSAWFRSFGRLKQGVTQDAAHADLEVIQAQLATEFPDTDARLKPEVQSYKETIVGSARGSLWLVFAAVSVLLLIACTNIASLLLSRAAQRQQEIAIRFSLGSSRWAIASQTLVETGVLAIVGAALGLFVAASASAALRSFAAGFPRIEELALDAPSLLATATSIVIVTLLCGLAPALRSARGEGVARGGRGQTSVRRPLQWSFVGVQVALSVVLLAAAGLLARSFDALGRVDPGFDSNRVLTFRLSGSYGERRDRMAQDVQAMLVELRGLPGVEAVATSSPVPGVLNDRSGFELGASDLKIEGRADEEQPIRADFRIVSAGYFEAMRIAVLAGETCRPPQAEGAPEVVVNRTFVDHYLGGRSPVGSMMSFGNGAAPSRIIGVAADTRDLGVDLEPTPTTYSCGTAIAFPPLAFLVRTSTEPRMALGGIRQLLKRMAPTRSVYDVMSLEQRMGAVFAQNRLRTALTASFALAALLLAAVGIYGTLSYVTSLSRRDVGLRLALGALPGRIIAQFLLRALRVVAVACLVGTALSLVATRSLSGMLYGVSPSDPLTLAVVVAIVLAVAALAAFVPALRAARIEPVRVLREE